MDGFITILILVALAAFSSSKKKKKKAQEKAAEARAFKEANEAIEQAKIPFSKDEWEALLKAQAQPEAAPEPKAAPAAKPAKAAKPVKAAKPARAAKPAKTAKPEEPRPVPAAAAPALHMEDDEPEGTVSTQGESIAEHAAHVARIHAEEQRLVQTQQTLQTLRGLNRQKLRDAVVMSEILGKPVSLRPRGLR